MVASSGDGLRRPLNAPPAGAVGYGVQPGTNNAVVLARRVIVFGPNDGIFVYNGTPGPNTLIASTAAGTGKDAYGNWYLPGTVAYGPDTFTGTGYIATQISNGFSIQWYHAATMTGATTPWTTEAVIQWNAGGLLLQYLSGPLIIQGAPVTITADSWHDLRPLLNSFVGTVAGQYPPQYRLNGLGRVEVFGIVQLPATYNATTVQTLASAYFPGHTVYEDVTVISNIGAAPANSGTAQAQIDTSGNLTFHNLPTGLSGGQVFMDFSYPLNSSGLITS